MAKTLLMKKRLDGVAPELDELAEQVGEFMRYWGFKKIHGKIWLHLFLAAEPLDAGRLMKRTGVSKALMSITLKDLVDYRVIEIVGESDRDTTLYKANPDLMEAIFHVLRTREQKMVSHIHASWEQVKRLGHDAEGVKIDAGRVNELGEFVDAGRKMLECFLLFRPMNANDFLKFRECGEALKAHQ